MSLFGNFQRLHGATAVLLAGVLLGASPPAPTLIAVYHCVGGANLPPRIRGEKYTTGIHVREYKIDESTIKGILGHSRCGGTAFPRAYLRYRLMAAC
jgi:hypothetical protein